MHTHACCACVGLHACTRVSPNHFCVPLRSIHSSSCLYVLETVVFKPDVLIDKQEFCEALMCDSTHGSNVDCMRTCLLCVCVCVVWCVCVRACVRARVRAYVCV